MPITQRINTITTMAFCQNARTAINTRSSLPPLVSAPQIKKTSEATLTTIQDMVTIEDYDVSECFHHSRSTESVKSAVSETYLSKPSIAKRRANQQETEQFYFMVGRSGRSPAEPVQRDHRVCVYCRLLIDHAFVKASQNRFFKGELWCKMDLGYV